MRRKAQPKDRKLSRLRQPAGMSLGQWQVGLRKQFGRQQKFQLKNLGSELLFSDFRVTNPETKRSYRVAIRGAALGENYCSCPDFAVNLLGTCKHIEFTLGRLERKSGAKAALALGFRPEYSEIYLHYGAAREVLFRPGTKCPDALRKSARNFFDADGRLRSDAFGRFPNFLKRAASGRHELRCYADVLAYVAQVRDREALSKAVDKAFPAGARSAAFKTLLRADLYAYQRAGALFAAKAGRCLIADDMGLGKTIQVIAATEILARHVGLERVLVVCPTSLKHQWQSEIEKFTERQALVVEGLLPKRRKQYQAEAFYKLTNYDVVHRDLEWIRQWQPEVVVLDEAQRIKNWKTRTAQSVKQLDSEYAFVLTGTPLENRLEELHSIVEFVDRFRLGPMYRFLAEHQHVNETGRVVGYRNLSRISRTLKPILIRRTKDKVLKQLPARLEKRLFVPMTSAQRDLHDENAAIVAKIVAKWKRWRFLSEKDQLRLRIALQNMRMSCNSTYLLDQSTDHGTKADETVRLLGEMLEDPAAKVVIFSQWVRTHELLLPRLQRRKWQHVVFHGSVPGSKRQSLIRRFTEDTTCRLFLSTDAGGVGLNLQQATAVINMDQPWNPAVLEQRIGRVHRLGQHRPVRVIHFIAEQTIEEGMLALLQFKRSMFTGVLDGGQDEVFLGGTKLQSFMKTVEKATTSIYEPVPTELEETGAADGDGKASARAKPTAPTAAPSATKDKPGSAAAGPSSTEDRTLRDQLWTDVTAAGLQFLNKLNQAVTDGGAGKKAAGGSAASLVTHDEKTGQSYFRLPLPEPDVVQKIIDVLGALGRPR